MSFDEKVVELKFNNRDFEKNVKTTLQTLETLKNSLNLDASAKSLSNLNTAGKNFSLQSITDGVNAISDRFSTLGIIGMTVLQNLTTAAMDLGGKLIEKVWDPIVGGGSKRALNIQQAQFQFEGLGMDVDKAMESALYAVKGTAYGLDEAAIVASQLGATGIEAGDDMSKALRAVSGVAAMTSSSYEEMGHIFTTVAGNGRLMGDQLRQLSGRGMNAAAVLAKEFGLTEATVREMVSKGEVSFEMFYTAMDNAFGEHAVKANELFTGALANTRAALARVGATVAGPAFEDFRDVFNALIPIIDGVSEELKPVTDGIIRFVDVVAKGAVKTLGNFDPSTMSDSFEKMGKFIDNVTDSLSTFGDIFKNIFSGISSFITPIKDAFRDIFPKKEGNSILKFAETIERFTSNFILSDIAGENLKNTFKGVFAIFSIGIETIKDIINWFKNLTSNITIFDGLGGKILEVTGNWGEYLTELSETVRVSDIVSVAFDKLKQALTKVKDGVVSAVSSLKEFLGLDGSTFEAFADRVGGRLESLGVVGEWFAGIFEGVENSVKKAEPHLTKAKDAIGDFLKDAKELINSALGNYDFNNSFDFINAGLFGGILIVTKSISDNIRSLISGMGNLSTSFSWMPTEITSLITGITGVMQGIQGVLLSMQSSIKADVIVKIATAVAILAASAIALSLVDSKKLAGALVALATMFGEIIGSLVVFTKTIGPQKIGGLMSVGTFLIMLAGAIGILSGSLIGLSSLSWESLAVGLSALTSLISIMVGSAVILKKASGAMLTGAGTLISFALAITILIGAIKLLGAMDPKELAQGLIGLGALIAEVALFISLAKFQKGGASVAVGLMGLATALIVLSTAVKKFGEMDPDQMLQGLIGIGAVLTQMAIFAQTTSNLKTLVSTAVGMTILAGSLMIFAEAVEKFGDMEWDELGKGLVGMAGSLAIVAGAMNLMPKNMVGAGAGLIIVSAALVILSHALQNMGGMSWDEIGRGLVALAGSLAVIVIAMQFMTTALPGAAALLVVSGALAVLAPVLLLFGTMSWDSIARGLTMLAGVFLIIGGAGYLLGAAVPAILGLSVAIALIGVGALAAGIGLTAFSAGLVSLAISGSAGAAALVLLITSLLGLIPLFARKIGEGIIAFAQVIRDGAPAIAEAVKATMLAWVDVIVEVIPAVLDAVVLLVTKLLETINTLAPDIIDTVLNLVTTLLTKLAEYLPDMIQAGMDIVIGILEGIANNIEDITIAAVDIAVNFLNGIASKLSDIIQAGVNLVLKFLDGVADAIRNNKESARASMKNLIMAMIDAIIYNVTESIKDIKKIGKKLIESGFIQGLKDKFVDSVQAFKDLIKGGVDAILGWNTDLKNAGKNVIDGFIQGIKDKIGAVGDAASSIGKKTLDSLKSFLGINSPARKLIPEGGNTVKGFAIGLTKFGSKVKDAAINVGKIAVDSLSKAVSDISKVVDANLDAQPTIRPVLDLSDIKSGAKNINSMFGNTHGIEVSAAYNKTLPISRDMRSQDATEQLSSTNKSISFVQNNYSPTALSRLDIYRQTKNQFSAMKVVVDNI